MRLLFLALTAHVAHSVSTSGPVKQASARRRAQSQRRQQVMKKSQARNYRLLSSEEIRNRLLEWKDSYPDLCHVTTSQEAYGLPAAGDASDCPFDDGPGCKNYILTIQDFVAHPEGSDSSNRLPEVFLSGLLHGNERVGPTAVVESATLLLEAASCEAKPNLSKKPTSDDSSLAWEKELAQAHACRESLRINKGVDDKHRKWLARLVTTRRIVIVPTSNALGYYRDEREEDGVDPNRDFPYDLKNPKKCMQSIAARTLNEIFREHMFQLSLTFHGGMEVVAYEWGAPTYLNFLSPDDEAQSQIAHAYSQYGGGWPGTRSYDVGTMNDLVYYVRGGFEDFAYAGSWDPDRVIPCTPTTFGGYDRKKTIYNKSTLRVFNMLIETSDDKNPPSQILGTSLDVLDADTAGNGHVSRNIRLSLLAAEMVEPYVSLLGTDDLLLTDDVVPLGDRGDKVCQDIKTIMISKDTKETTVYWTVGGSMTIDDTSVWYGKWDDLPHDSSIGCMGQPDVNVVQKSLNKGTPITSQKGSGRFSKDGAQPSTELGTNNSSQLGPVFAATIDTSQFQPHDRIVVIAVARVDQTWKNQPDDISPNIPPQSHIVNARTNPDWKHKSAGKILQGRLDWYSIPLTVVIGDGIGHEVGAFEVSNRLIAIDSDIVDVVDQGSPVDDVKSDDATDSGWSQGGIILVALSFTGFACIILVKKRRRFRHRPLVVSEYEEGYFEGAKQYTDKVDDENGEKNEAGDLELMEYA